MRLNLRTLLVMVICLTGLSVIYQRPLLQLCLVAVTVLLLVFIKPGDKKPLFKRLSRIGRIILVIFVFQLLFRRTGEIIFELGILRITIDGFNYALASSLRFFLIILAAGLLMDIPFKEYLIALKAWKFPDEIAFVVSSTIHFLPVFNQIFRTKLDTLKLRGVVLEELKLSERFAIFKLLIIPVLAASINDIRYRAISLELRAFRLHPNRTSLHTSKLHAIDRAVITIMIIITGAVVYLMA